MSGLQPILPISLLPGDAAAGRLLSTEAGALLRGRVVPTRNGLAVEVGGERISLPPNTGLAAGDLVNVSASRTPEGLQLTITLRGAARAPAQVASPSTGQVASAVLEGLGGVNRGLARGASGVLAAAQELPEGAVRALTNLFTSRGNLLRDLGSLLQMVQSAGAQGVAVQQLAQSLRRLVAQYSTLDVETLEAVVKEGAESSKSTPESRLAARLRGDKAIQLPVDESDLRTLVFKLRQDSALQRYLSASGSLDSFEEVAGRVVERAVAGHVQNLRGAEQNYVFIELPLGSADEAGSVQIHLFGENTDSSGREKRSGGFAALDIYLSRLGALWVTLDLRDEVCRCHLRAMSEEVVAALNESSDELVSALAAAGYVRPQIRVSKWNGNRVAEVGRLLSPLTGIDLRG